MARLKFNWLFDLTLLPLRFGCEGDRAGGGNHSKERLKILLDLRLMCEDEGERGTRLLLRAMI